ncbi:MAG: transglutaminase-like domain-containing protein [Acidobacteriota bacterium]|nr:transglutaminase-like domain-containing protein [Acidobacteriota bacterium]
MRARTAVLLLFLFSVPGLAAEQRWYVFSIGKTPVGYLSEESDGKRTRTILFAKLVRLGSNVEMKFDTTVTESAEGELLSLSHEALLSKQPSRLDVTVERDRIRVASPPNERFVEKGSAPILGPVAIVRRTVALQAIEDVLEYSMFSPEMQRVVHVKRTVLATEDATCNGAYATKIEERIEGLPMPRTLWVDANGITVADTMEGPFGAMSTCRATREAALSANGELPADLYERTVAHANVRLADPSAVDRIVLRVTPRDPSQPLPAFVTHNQRMLDRNTVEIRRGGGSSESASVTKELLTPNALIESANPEIIKTAAEITAEAEPFKVGSALTKWVAQNMKMDAGIVMAPASELIRDRKGTCVGFATLLASLARARGIPARIAMGYVYYGGIWGGHAWTEMLIDGRWLPFDAAVYAPGVASATRLAAGASSFADGGGDLNMSLALLFGRVEIDILEYEEAGRVTRVPRGQQAWRVEGSRYINPGLGLNVDASGWTIERADSTWPSTLVVAFRRGNNTVEVHEKIADPDR